MKHVIKVTETFEKLIVVEANSEEDAIDKCWHEYEYFTRNDDVILFDHNKDISELDYEIATNEDKQMVLEHEDLYGHLN